MSEPPNTQPSSYDPPVSALLTYGKITNWTEWPNYLELGFTAEHVPDLIRLALDKHLNWLITDEETPEIWAPIHAVRALGQLRAEEAVEPLLALFHEFEDDGDSDWVGSELARAYRLIGPAALPALTTYFQDETRGMYPRTETLESLEQIAAEYPETRAEVVAIISQQLEKYAANDPTFNAFLISTLTDMKATETLPLIEQAYADNYVELSITGDWDDIQVDFGLKEFDPNKQRSPLFPFLNFLNASPDDADEPPLAFPTSFYTSQRKAASKKKSKRKQADKTRKMNRRRKKR